MSQLTSPTATEIRRELEELVFRDLLGPAAGPDEEIDEMRVSDRYIVGMLASKKQSCRAEEQDELAVDGMDSVEEGATDPGSLPIETLIPSSFGFTFAVEREAKAIRITARWGNYIRTDSEFLQNEKTGAPKKVWKRVPIEGVSPPIPLKVGLIENWIVNPEQGDVYVRGVIRDLGHLWIVSVFLVNEQTAPLQLADSTWLFQPELIVESPDGDAIFRKRAYHRDKNRIDPLTYDEEETLDMVYRNHVEFAVGHGISVHAETSPNDPKQAVRIRTVAIPAYEVPKQTPPTVEDNPDLAGLVLDMKELSETADPEFKNKLGVITDAYRKWIENEQRKIDDPNFDLKDYRPVAESAVKECETILRRIQEGIDLLASNPIAAEAFRFANQAMWKQRVHTLLSLQKRRDGTANIEELDLPQNRSWYPFQLAFVLLNLPGLTDLHHSERAESDKAIADLLWFPTGGGKTEAYLGLSAYTMGVRRLQGEIGGRSGEPGLAVLMRYTLRLLTIQQFQRATALICACEVIRREEVKKWGNTPFRIGMWVGMRITPNTTEQSNEAIRQKHDWQASAFSNVGTPAQLTHCPWCGCEIQPGKHIRVDENRKRTILSCGDPLGRCEFSQKKSPHEGIPVLVVDEEIYRNPPALLIATVDKFAQMPWKGAIQTFFGQITGLCPRHGFRSPEIEDADSHPQKREYPAVKTVDHALLRPPDLIIQDELHLISGPLGTLVGLYETAIDQLCSWEVDGKKVRPKVIASTATIRRASEQIKSIFYRSVQIFPPQCTEIQDNFFSIQRKPGEEYPGRRYVGICAPGKRNKAVLIRVYVALLAASQKLYENYGVCVDPWMTVAGYFNSMRELGGTRRLVDDDIRTRLEDMDKRGLARRYLNVVEELTSRKGATDIPRVLDRIESVFEPERGKKRKNKNGKKETTPFPIDVLLATNMISVGVDVQRLGLMVVTGQPKTTAEYIQATSRVGRKFPGLICTIYNWARPRDLSHYETFEHYHATFYKHVESISVTPFAARALDRGLTSILVSLIRLAGQDFNENKQAGELESNHFFVKAAIDAIVNRATGVLGDSQIGEEIKKMLNLKIDLWLKEARNTAGGRILGYEKREKAGEKEGVVVNLLQSPSLDRWDEFTCLTSLRDVEPAVSLIFNDYGLDEGSSACEANTTESCETGVSP